MAGLNITKDDHGKTIALDRGQHVVLQLEDNPTTGYRWEVIEGEGLDVEMDYEVASTSAVGGGGQRTFHITFPHVGSFRLFLKRHRSWEQDVEPLDQFEAQFEVS